MSRVVTKVNATASSGSVRPVIALVPVKNEAWILPSLLGWLAPLCDQIIIGDQMSTDGSRDIYRLYSNVVVMDNRAIGHSNEIRWKLLDRARELSPEAILLFIDADEYLPRDLFEEKLLPELRKAKPGTRVVVPWINLWKSLSTWRADGYWGRLTKEVAFVDDGLADYRRELVVNDHTGRLPGPAKYTLESSVPLVHLEFAYWDRVQVKQAWYRCSELLRRDVGPRRINYRYRDTGNRARPCLKDLPKQWAPPSTVPSTLDASYQVQADWRYQEMLSWFHEHGILAFEGLDIWHIEPLQQVFRKRQARVPAPKQYPTLLILLYSRYQYLRNRWREYRQKRQGKM